MQAEKYHLECVDKWSTFWVGNKDRAKAFESDLRKIGNSKDQEAAKIWATERKSDVKVAKLAETLGVERTTSYSLLKKSAIDHNRQLETEARVALRKVKAQQKQKDELKLEEEQKAIKLAQLEQKLSDAEHEHNVAFGKLLETQAHSLQTFSPLIVEQRKFAELAGLVVEYNKLAGADLKSPQVRDLSDVKQSNSRLLDAALAWKKWREGQTPQEITQARHGKGGGRQLYQDYVGSLIDRKQAIDRQRELEKLHDRGFSR